MRIVFDSKYFNWLQILGFILALTILSSCSSNIDPKLIQAAEDINAQCPISVDRETTLDNVAALADNIFEYNYTFNNVVADSIDIEALRVKMENSIHKNVKVSPEMDLYSELGTTVRYAYMDQDGKFLFEIEVTPEIYDSF